MRRTWRTVRWGLTALAAATLIAWPLSRWWTLWVVLPGPRKVQLSLGCLTFERFTPGLDDGSPLPPGVHLSRFYIPANTHRKVGMVWGFHHELGSFYEWVQVPMWAIVPIPMAAAGLAWRGPLRAARRRRRGACLVCGYDRRGLAAGGPCPECGAVPEVERPPG